MGNMISLFIFRVKKEKNLYCPICSRAAQNDVLIVRAPFLVFPAFYFNVARLKISVRDCQTTMTVINISGINSQRGRNITNY